MVYSKNVPLCDMSMSRFHFRFKFYVPDELKNHILVEDEQSKYLVLGLELIINHDSSLFLGIF